MNRTGKIVTGVGLLSGIGLAIAYGLNVKKASDMLESQTSVMVHKLDVSGLTLTIRVKIKNPSPVKFLIQSPFVKIGKGDQTVATSKLTDKVFTLPPKKEITLDDIMMEMPYSNSTVLISSLTSALRDKKPLQLEAVISTKVKIGWFSFPYEEKEPIAIDPSDIISKIKLIGS